MPNKNTIVAWIRLAGILTAGILLAYGVIRAPDRPPSLSVTRRVLVAAIGETKTMAEELKASYAPTGPNDPASSMSVTVLELSTEPAAAGETLRKALEASPPDAVLVLAPSPAGSAFRLEVQAFGADRKRYLARLPLHAIQKKLKAEGYPAVISYSPENAVASAALQALVEQITREGSRIFQGGLVQIPGQGEGESSRSPAEWGTWVSRALRVALDATVRALPSP